MIAELTVAVTPSQVASAFAYDADDIVSFFADVLLDIGMEDEAEHLLAFWTVLADQDDDQDDDADDQEDDEDDDQEDEEDSEFDEGD